MPHQLILGTRPSKMAVMMAQTAKARLEAAYSGLTVEVRTYASTGDTNQGDLKKIGGKGAFVKDLELRLLSGEIDCAIHALKDVPGDVDMHPDLEMTCFFEREDPRDALIMREGLALPTDGAGLTLATSSPRRKAFLHRLYPQAKIIPLRGNVDTRMRKLAEAQFDGMVLSYAGLHRLGLQSHASHVYSAEEMLPAVGQGVMSLQVRRLMRRNARSSRWFIPARLIGQCRPSAACCACWRAIAMRRLRGTVLKVMACASWRRGYLTLMAVNG